MRLLILDNEFPPLGGGTGVINYHVMTELDQRAEIQVDLITSSRTNEQYEEEAFGAHGRIYKVPVDNQNIHHATNIELLRYTLRGTRQALRLACQVKYDLCWAYAAVPAGFIALALRQRVGLPYILITQGPDIPWYERRYYPIYPILLPIIRFIWGRAAVVTAQSLSSRELISKSSAYMPVTIIHNGVDIDNFSPPPEKMRQRGLREQMIFLCSGRLIERKGQQHLIEAAHLLNQRGYSGKFKILLIGTGDNEATLRDLCSRLALQDSVTFAGFMPRQAMPGYYADADVFVLPSYNEGMSVALLEALASGLPAIVTETGGTTELVKENGLIVPWANPDRLSEAMEKFLRDPALCQQMGQQSREIAKDFSWQATAKAYLDLSYKCLAPTLMETGINPCE